MAWTTVPVFAVSEVVTAAKLSAWSVDVGFLYGDTAWNTMGLAATWANVGGSFGGAQYRIAGTVVYLRGRIASGSVGTTITTLPSGYRPTTTLTFGGAGFGAWASLQVTAPGVVSHVAGSTDVSLDCVIFDVL